MMPKYLIALILSINMAWAASAAQDAEQAFQSAAAAFQEQFDLTQMQADEIAMDYAQAVGIFAALPEGTDSQDYDKLVLPHLINAYEHLGKFTSLADVSDAANDELQAWIAG